MATTENTSESLLSAERIYASMCKAGEDWSDLDAAASALEETKNPMLAKFTLEAIARGAKSVAAAETEALANPVYIKHLENMVEARRLANRAKVKWVSVQVLAEVRRSQESTRRQEMKFA